MIHSFRMNQNLWNFVTIFPPPQIGPSFPVNTFSILLILSQVTGVVTLLKSLRTKHFHSKQGRIHSYPSGMRVGRGFFCGHLIIWAGAVKPKTVKKNKKNNVWWTEQQTDGPTKRGIVSNSTQLKNWNRLEPSTTYFTTLKGQGNFGQ